MHTDKSLCSAPGEHTDTCTTHIGRAGEREAGRAIQQIQLGRVGRGQGGGEWVGKHPITNTCHEVCHSINDDVVITSMVGLQWLDNVV